MCVLQHEYGVRMNPASQIGTIYTGFGGEFGAIGENGEMGRYFVGARPRVWEVMLKGAKTLYLSFSEPVTAASIANAITLTNKTTGAFVTATTQAAGATAAAELAFDLNGASLDPSVPHVLRIAKTVVNADGTGLDGAFVGDGFAARISSRNSVISVCASVYRELHPRSKRQAPASPSLPIRSSSPLANVRSRPPRAVRNAS